MQGKLTPWDVAAAAAAMGFSPLVIWLFPGGDAELQGAMVLGMLTGAVFLRRKLLPLRPPDHRGALYCVASTLLVVGGLQVAAGGAWLSMEIIWGKDRLESHDLYTARHSDDCMAFTEVRTCQRHGRQVSGRPCYTAEEWKAAEAEWEAETQTKDSAASSRIGRRSAAKRSDRSWSASSAGARPTPA